MGKAVPGMYEVTVSHAGYFDKTIMLEFENGVVLDPTIELLPYPSHVLSGKVVDENDMPVPNALVLASGPNGIYKTNGDDQGEFLIPAVYEGTYDVQAGLWGYVHESQIDFFSAQDLTLVAHRGYKDDFDLDLGWTVSGDATSGIWTREMPDAQILFDTWQCGSDGDSPTDLGPYAYSTGASSSNDPTEDEVSGGATWLSSPPMDLTYASNVRITFDYWLCEFPPNQFDGLYVWLTNGADTVLLEHLSNDTITGSWQSKVYDGLSLTPPLDQIQFLVSAEDTTTGTSLYVLNAHFDNFELQAEGLSISDQQLQDITWKLYPNPVTNRTVYLELPAALQNIPVTIRIADLQGRVLFTKNSDPTAKAIELEFDMPAGLYILQWQGQNGLSGVQKLVVLSN
jgi:hypothetical protein